MMKLDLLSAALISAPVCQLFPTEQGTPTSGKTSTKE
jgi:hypothetical protein